MDITEKVYNFMKNSKDKNGFVPTVKQMAKEFTIPEHEVDLAINQLQQSGRIKITDIPGKTTIDFCD